MPKKKRTPQLNLDFTLRDILSDLKNHRYFKSILVIIIVATVGIAASQALFRDIEQSKKGTFLVGTLDLEVDDAGFSKTTTSIVVENIGKTKSLDGARTYDIRNVGSLDGELYFRLANVENLENGCNEPEALVDTTCDNPGDGQGELGSELEFEVTTDDGNGERTLVVSNLAPGNESEFETQWKQADPKVKIPAGKTIPVTIKWQSQAGALGNEVQSDSVKFDMVFELKQIITQ